MVRAESVLVHVGLIVTHYGEHSAFKRQEFLRDGGGVCVPRCSLVRYARLNQKLNEWVRETAVIVIKCEG